MKRTLLIIGLAFCLDSAIAQTADSLVAWYPFNGNAVEELGTGIDGLVNGAILTSDRFLHQDSAYLFISDYPSFIDLGDSFDEIFTAQQAQFSFSFWIQPDDDMLNKAIFAKYGNSNCGQNGREFLIRVNNSSKLEFIYYRYLNTTNTRQGVQGSTLIQTNSNWTHIVISYDGTIPSSQGLEKIKLYVNGVLETSSYTANTGTLAVMEDGSSHMGIGLPLGSSGQQCGDFAFDGKIDDVKLFDKVLTQDEVDTLFNEPDPMLPLLKDDEIVLDIIKLYPNPVRNSLKLNIDKTVKIRVLDITGKLVLTDVLVKPSESIDVSMLKDGFYLLQVLSNNKPTLLKFCKITK